MKEMRDFVVAAATNISKFRKEWLQYYKQAETLPHEDFWKLLLAYRQEVVRYRLQLKRTDHEDPAHELGRKSVTGEGKWTIDAMVAFAKTYEEVSSSLYKSLWNTVERGDDGYGDLLDSFPLFGPEMVQKALNKEYVNEEEIVGDAVLHGHSKEFINYVLGGENYNRMALHDKARYWKAKEILHEWLDGLDAKTANSLGDICLPEGI